MSVRYIYQADGCLSAATVDHSFDI